MIIALCFCTTAQDRSLKKESFRNLNLNRDWIIVKYSSPSYEAPGTPFIQSSPKARREPSILDGMMKVQIPDGVDPIKFCNQYLSDPAVLYAEPIIREQLLASPSDPLLENQYYLDNIRAKEAWDITKGDDDITVAIIDTGMDLDHEDLQANLWTNPNDPIDGIDNDGNGYIDDFYGYDFADGDNQPESDRDSHGARVAGVSGAVADNGIGIAGIGYQTKIAALKGFTSSDNLSSGLFEAIMYAADNGIEILNLSWGSIRQPLQSEQDIINYAVLEKDVVIVAAAGNDGNRSTAEERFYPASYDNVLSVAGSTSDDTKWSGSSYNHSVDITAPAAGILSTSNGDSYNSSAGFGTSFAAPMVAATAALVKDQFPTLSAQQVMERVRVTADEIYDIGSNALYDGKLGSGRLNAYRAVTAGNLKSLRAENVLIEKPWNDPVFFGDTITISFDLTNYLQPVSDPIIYISSPDGEFTTGTQQLYPGAISTLQSASGSLQLIIDEDLPPETLVDIRLDIQDGAYTDFQFIDIETAPNYADLSNNEIALTVAGDGRLAIVDYENFLGSGLVYQGENILFNSGILIATDETSVSDNVIADFDTYTRDNDFIGISNYKIGHHPFADRFGYSEFSDNNHSLQIEQSNITSEDGKFVINRYRVVNTGADTLKNISFGVFADWDLGDFSTNYSAFDVTNSYLLARNIDANLFAGTQVLGNGTLNASALDIANSNGNTADISEVFSDSDKYQFLAQTSLQEAGSIGDGNDVAGILGLEITAIPPQSFEYIDLIFAVGDSEAELTSNFQSAQDYLADFTENPQVLETYVSCDGGLPTIDPEGELFIFYEDALGTFPIDTASSFSPAAITQDTSFYARNMDLGYASEISEVRIRLINDIAEFSMEQDTLYLDQSTNIATFFDESIDAISWLWDFGQGNQSTLQNPSILFDTPGTYPITLSVENRFGCMDNITKNLVVANRPDDLVFSEIIACPQEGITLSHALASKLFIYSSMSQMDPVLSGSSVDVGPFESDTLLYVSGLVNGFRTNRSTVAIDVQEVLAAISIQPDTLSNSFDLVATAEVETGSSVSWTINGATAGSELSVTTPATQGVHLFELEVTGQNGCTITRTASFEVSTSVTPQVSDLVGCAGTGITLSPENGEVFAFYADDLLTQLISKGSQLDVDTDTTIYVVSLEDGLPGDAAEVTISFEDFQPEIVSEVTRIGSNNQVVLEVASEQSIVAYRWFVDGALASDTQDPIFFFEDGDVTITLEAESANGCLESQTLELTLSAPEIPLGLDEEGFRIYPNPTTGIVEIVGASEVNDITVTDLAGRVILQLEEYADRLDLSKLLPGIYILELQSVEGVEKRKVIVER